MSLVKEIKSQKFYITTHKKEIRLFLEGIGLKSSQIKRTLKFAQYNIVLRLYLNVIKIERKNKRNFVKEIGLILIYTRILNLQLLPSKSEEIKKMVKLLSTIPFKVEKNFSENIEEELLNLSEVKIISEKYLSFCNNHNVYCGIGNLFAQINHSKGSKLYNYGYLLAMYLYVSYEYKKYDYRDMYEVFFFKLKVNTALNKATMRLTNIYYNGLIIKTNKWISKIVITRVIKVKGEKK